MTGIPQFRGHTKGPRSNKPGAFGQANGRRFGARVPTPIGKSRSGIDSDPPLRGKFVQFWIPRMDCSAEVQLIRMKLEPLSEVRRLQFDVPARKLEVFHTSDGIGICSRLEQLNLGAIEVSQEEVAATQEEARSTKEKGLPGYYFLRRRYGQNPGVMGSTK